MRVERTDAGYGLEFSEREVRDVAWSLNSARQMAADMIEHARRQPEDYWQATIGPWQGMVDRLDTLLGVLEADGIA